MRFRARTIAILAATVIALVGSTLPAAASHLVITEYSTGAGTQPQGMAAGYGSLWVTDAANNDVLRIDPATGGVVDTISLPAAELANAIATGPATGPLRGVWVAPEANFVPQNVMFRINPDTGTIVDTYPLPVGDEPSRIAVGLGAVWYTVVSKGTINRLDPATGDTTAYTSAGLAEPIGITLARGRVWVAEQAGQSIARLNPSNGNIRRFPLGAGVTAFDLEVVGRNVWFTGGISEHVGRLNLRTGRVNLITTTTDGFPAEMVRVGRDLYFTDIDVSQIGHVDRFTRALDTTDLPAGGAPFGMARLGTKVWFAEIVGQVGSFDH